MMEDLTKKISDKAQKFVHRLGQPFNLELNRYKEFHGFPIRHVWSPGLTVQHKYSFADGQMKYVDAGDADILPNPNKYVFVGNMNITEQEIREEKGEAWKAKVVNVTDKAIIKSRAYQSMSPYDSWQREGIVVVKPKQQDASKYSVDVYLKMPETPSPLTYMKDNLEALMEKRGMKAHQTRSVQ
jgi:hypothetical protein